MFQLARKFGYIRIKYFMRHAFIAILFLIIPCVSFSQDAFFRPTYVYEGFIKTKEGKEIKVNVNLMILLDSTIVGSYFFQASWGSLRLAGYLGADGVSTPYKLDSFVNIV
jgi:hypothetical protein